MENSAPVHFAKVAKELESGIINKALWAQAYAEQEGNPERSRAAYIRLRVQQLERAQELASALRRKAMLATNLENLGKSILRKTPIVAIAVWIALILVDYIYGRAKGGVLTRDGFVRYDHFITENYFFTLIGLTATSLIVGGSLFIHGRLKKSRPDSPEKS